MLLEASELRKEVQSTETNHVVAPLLMKFSHGCQQVSCWSLNTFPQVVINILCDGFIVAEKGAEFDAPSER